MNMAYFFKSKPAPGPIFPTVYNQTYNVMEDEYKKYVADKQDVNTALNNAEKAINDLLEQEKLKK